MHIRKIRKLIETLKAMPAERYEQKTWIDNSRPVWVDGKWLDDKPCGTRACLAGHAVLMEGYKPRKNKIFFDEDEEFSVAARARKILGISTRTAERLFSASSKGWRREDETWKCDTKPKQVACAIRELEDLITLGPYDKRVRKPRPELVARRQHRLRINRQKRVHLRPGIKHERQILLPNN